MELGVVLVIIGFLSAAVVSGQSLLEQARLRTFVGEFNEFTTAYNNFVLAYGAPPGDISSYSAFASSASLITIDSSQTPYGNGDGLIVSQNNGSDETRLALKDLNVAGMIRNSITLVVSGTNMVPGQSTPASVTNSTIGYMFLSYATSGSPSYGTASIDFLGSMSDIFTDNPELGGSYNVLYLGSVSSHVGETLLGASISPSVAFSLDKKIDDGAVANGGYVGTSTGKFRALNGENVMGCTTAGGTQYVVTSSATPMCLVGMRME